MAILDVTDVIAIELQAESVITAPDAQTYSAAAGSRYGIPAGQTALIITPAGKVNCMVASGKRTADNVMFQVFTVSEVRTSV